MGQARGQQTAAGRESVHSRRSRNGGTAGSATTGRFTQPPAFASPGFVGREHDLAALGEALAQPPAVVLIEGEAGIGKSRLIQEFLAGTNAAERTLVATCPPFFEPYTLGPVVDAVRQATDSVRGLPLTGLAGALRPLLPEWASDLPPAPEPLEDPMAARHRLFRAFVELLDCLRVAVLVVEDVHWADEATIEFLLFLASRRPQTVNLVVTYRPEDVRPGSLLLRLTSRLPAGVTHRRLVLGPLGVPETVAFVSSMLAGEPVSEEFATFLHQRTDGLPLALEESIRLMQDRADLFRQDGVWVRRRLDRIEVPPSIRDAVLERVARLDADARSVLDACAVLTDPADPATVGEVADLPADRAATGLAAALVSGLLREDPRGNVVFRHALAARAVYESLTSPQRRALHGRARRSLERLPSPPVAQLARHCREAGDIAAWCRYAEQAADLARQSGDEATASVLLHSIITTVDLPIPRLVELIDRIDFSFLPGPEPCAKGIATLRAVLDRPGLSPTERGTVRSQLSRLLMISGAYEAGRREAERALPLLPPDSAEAARVRIYLGYPLGPVRPAEEHLRWLREAVTPSPAIPPAQRLALLSERVGALLMLGEESGWAEAQLIPEDTASPEEIRPLLVGHVNLAHVAMLWGRYDTAEARLRTAETLVERHQADSHASSILGIRVRVKWFTGAWRDLAEQATAVAGNEDLPSMYRSEADLVLALLDAAAGKLDAAERRLLEVQAEAQRRRAVDRHIESTAALAEVYLAAGRVDDALRVTEEPVDIAVHRGIWVLATEVTPARVAALVAANRHAEARELVDAFSHTLGDRAAPAPQASLLLCRAILNADANPLVAAGMFAEAARCWAALPRPYDALLARERQARCLLAAGRVDPALTELTDVLDRLSALGARGAADRVLGTLREHGRDPHRPRVGRPSYGDRLSPRELEVVALLAGGRANREIARELVLSTKTVASHIHSAMRKLRVRSRTALAVKAVELGLVSAAPPRAGDDQEAGR